jgi:hypothetical protein
MWPMVTSWLTERAQYILNAFRAVIAVLIGFHWVQWTPEQIALVIAAMESVFGVITAKTTISSTRVDTIVEKRVGDIVSTPTEVAARTGTGA